MGGVVRDMSDSPYARSFGARAQIYDRYRPRYPAAAIDFVLDGRAPQRILDLGAGTGLLTRDLIGRAPEVLAVEPDDDMRAVLATTVPEAEALAGSAERIPVPDASIDAVLVGQAFHWFARPAADRELARVLRPGGVVGLVWNFTDRKLAWVSRLYEATEQPAPPAGYQPSDLDDTLFTPSQEFRVEGERELPGPDGLIGLAHTWSWVINRTPEEQRRIDRRLRILISQHAELQRPVIRFPQLTKVIRQYVL
jgi:SAM-dependent methyltransferase